MLGGVLPDIAEAGGDDKGMRLVDWVEVDEISRQSNR